MTNHVSHSFTDIYEACESLAGLSKSSSGGILLHYVNPVHGPHGTALNEVIELIQPVPTSHTHGS